MKIISIDCGYSNAGYSIIDAGREDGHCFTVSSKFKSDVSVLESVGRCREIHRQLRNLIMAEYRKGEDIVLSAEFPHGGSKSGAAARSMAMAVGVTSSLYNCNVKYRYVATPNDVKNFVRHNMPKMCGLSIPKDAKIEKKLVKAFVSAFTSHRGGFKVLDGSDHAADAAVVGLLTATSLGLFEGLLELPRSIKLYAC